MAHIIDEKTTLVPTFLAAARYLLAQKNDDYQVRNLVLEIADPVTMSSADAAMIRAVDEHMRAAADDAAIERVAGTIFPQGVYLRHGYPAFFKKYLDIMSRSMKKGTWGTYAMRLMRRGKGASTINPLEILINKLKRATTGGHRYRNAYELSVIDAQVDLADNELDFGCEVPLYEPASDAAVINNMPCLSHLTFKLGADNTLHLTAIYRSHYYCAKALGNLIGLARLLAFVAESAELHVGSLTCISTFAKLDTEGWGGIRKVRALLA